MQWLRYYHETPTDPKWRAVAIEAGVPVHAVLAVWDCMMVNASESSNRGTLEGWNHRVIGAAIDLKGAEVEAIHAAMQGLTLEGDRLKGWEKRQRASDNVAARVKQHREKAKQERNVTLSDSNVTSDVGGASVTLPPLRAQITDTELRKDPHPLTPSPSVQRASPEARAVVAAFMKAKDARWPEAVDRVAPRMTMETLAQQHLDAGGTVDLLTEVIERAIRDWKNPTPPHGLSALRNTITDRVAEFARAGKPPPSNRPAPGQPEHIVPDRDSQTRQRLRTFRRTGDWHWSGEPRPDSPRCQIDRALLREEMGDEFMARFHPAASLPTPTHEAHHV